MSKLLNQSAPNFHLRRSRRWRWCVATDALIWWWRKGYVSDTLPCACHSTGCWLANPELRVMLFHVKSNEVLHISDRNANCWTTARSRLLHLLKYPWLTFLFSESIIATWICYSYENCARLSRLKSTKLHFVYCRLHVQVEHGCATNAVSSLFLLDWRYKIANTGGPHTAVGVVVVFTSLEFRPITFFPICRTHIKIDCSSVLALCVDWG